MLQFCKNFFASSIVTDGASVNVGEKAGVWNLLQNERSKSSASSDVKKPAPAPLLKVDVQYIVVS